MSLSDAIATIGRYVPIVGLTLALNALDLGDDRAQAADQMPQMPSSTAIANRPNASEPARLYVNPDTGSDRNTGNAEQPFQTLTHALERARPNTIIVLTPGTYSESSGEQFPISLRSGVTVFGNPEAQGEGVEIVGGGWLQTPTAGEQNVAILGFDGAGLSGVTVSNPDGSGIWVAGGTPWIVDNTIKDNDRHGLVVHDGTPRIVNNRFDDNDGADLEFSDRATPQMQGNQLDRRNGESIRYVDIDAGQSVPAPEISEPDATRNVTDSTAIAPRSSQPPSSRSTTPSIASADSPERDDPSNIPADIPADISADIVAWQGATSFPPVVRPSDTARPEPDRITAPRSLPLDPDLAIRQRATALRSPPPRFVPQITPIEPPADDVTQPSATNATTHFVENPATNSTATTTTTTARTSSQRLPAVPNVPNVPNVPTTSTKPRETSVLNPSDTGNIDDASTLSAAQNRDTSAARDTTRDTTGDTLSNSSPPIVAWGTPTGTPTRTSTGTSTRTTAPIPETTTADRPETLLRWNGLERPQPTSDLPPPIVNPADSPRPGSIVIAGQPPRAEASSPTPTGANRPPATTQTAPQTRSSTRRPAGLPSLLPLPVPDPNPPIGEAGTLPPPPSVAGDRPAWDLTPTQSGVPVRYRVLVESSASLEAVRAITDNAFFAQSAGLENIQAGVFDDQWRAEELLNALTAAGFTAWVMEF